MALDANTIAQVSAAVNQLQGTVSNLSATGSRLETVWESFGRSLVDAQRHLSKFNGTLAAVYAQAELRGIHRDIKSAQVTAGTTKELVDAFEDFRDDIQPIKDLITNIVNILGTTFFRQLGTQIEWLSRIAELLNRVPFLARDEKPGMVPFAEHIGKMLGLGAGSFDPIHKGLRDTTPLGGEEDWGGHAGESGIKDFFSGLMGLGRLGLSVGSGGGVLPGTSPGLGGLMNISSSGPLGVSSVPLDRNTAAHFSQKIYPEYVPPEDFKNPSLPEGHGKWQSHEDFMKEGSRPEEWGDPFDKSVQRFYKDTDPVKEYFREQDWLQEKSELEKSERDEQSEKQAARQHLKLKGGSLPAFGVDMFGKKGKGKYGLPIHYGPKAGELGNPLVGPGLGDITDILPDEIESMRNRDDYIDRKPGRPRPMPSVSGLTGRAGMVENNLQKLLSRSRVADEYSGGFDMGKRLEMSFQKAFEAAMKHMTPGQMEHSEVFQDFKRNMESRGFDPAADDESKHRMSRQEAKQHRIDLFRRGKVRSRVQGS